MTEAGPDTVATIRVYLVDDHEVVRRGLREVLEPGIEVVGESGSAAQAIRRIPALRPDVAVIDMRLPDGSGVDVCRSVRAIDPTIRALILTSYHDADALFSAIIAGASGYFLKEAGALELVDAVRRVAAGQSLLDPAVTSQVLERLRRAPTARSGVPGLSDQETRVLELIAQGLSNREIGQQLFLAEKTVKNYVSNILGKLGLERRAQAVIHTCLLY